MIETTSFTRRQTTRVALRGPVDLVCGSELVRGEARDVSEAGLGLYRLNAPLLAPVKVFLSVPQPCGGFETVMLSGEVTVRRLGRTGVRFVEPPPATLREYVAGQRGPA